MTDTGMKGCEMKEALVTAFKEMILDCSRKVLEQLDNPPAVWQQKHYQEYNDNGSVDMVQDIYQDPDFNVFYLMRYGYAYAFEYSVIHDAILRDFISSAKKETNLSVASIGCGAMIDAWALAYSKAKLQEEENAVFPEGFKIDYYGLDHAKWAIQFAGECSGEQPGAACRKLVSQCLTVCREPSKKIDITTMFTDDPQQVSQMNVFLFGKILNELPFDVFEKTIAGIREAAKNDCFNRDEIYVAISHSRATLSWDPKKYKKMGKRIVKAMNRKGRYKICETVLEGSPYFKLTQPDDTPEDIPKDHRLSVDTAGGKLKNIYCFSRRYSDEKHPTALHSRFMDYNMDFDDSDVLALTYEPLGAASLKRQLLLTRYISMQVFKLTKKEPGKVRLFFNRLFKK